MLLSKCVQRFCDSVTGQWNKSSLNFTCELLLSVMCNPGV